MRYKSCWMNWLVGGCLVGLSNVSAHSQNLTGQQIFDRMLRVYAVATAYQDVGQATTNFYDKGETQPKFTKVYNFETAYYRRTNQFKFHYKVEGISLIHKPEEMVIWTKGNDAFMWWTIANSSSKQRSLTYALGGATGVSSTTSRKIPGLLLSEPINAGWGIDSLKSIKLIGTAVQDNRPCYRLTGVYWKNQVAFLWIDQQSFLLLRLDEGVDMPGLRVKTSMTYRPILNKPIPVGMLQFTPQNH